MTSYTKQTLFTCNIEMTKYYNIDMATLCKLD